MAGPTHHFALGVGHHAAALKKIAISFGVDYEIITE
jgi:L-arabinose isomerase